MVVVLLTGCSRDKAPASGSDDFNYNVDQFEDMRVLRYKLPGFEQLAPEQKLFIWHLSEAALAGRDIYWDQNFKYNLVIRKTLEAIISSFEGDRESTDFKNFLTYAKRVFFASGIYHHYSNDKFIPPFSEEYFRKIVEESDKELLPVAENGSVKELLDLISPLLFDQTLYPKKIELDPQKDIVASSAVNFYEGVTQTEVEEYYGKLVKKDDPRPVSLGLNSKVIRKDGKIFEEVYSANSKYGEVIKVITRHLAEAMKLAENEQQRKEIELLVKYYNSGSLSDWDDYNVAWAGNTGSVVDYVNGFIETYNDPMGMKASWEAIVNYKDIEATKRTETITANSQWFEDNSPIDSKYKKEEVKGVAAKVINIAMLGGDCHPVSPLGINLPNADWIRKEVGSKSVTLANITDAIDLASQGSGFLEEFAASAEEIERVKKYGNMAGSLHTDLHECVGHASGKLAEGTDPNALKNYSSALEEARADIIALYFMPDEKLISLGLLPSVEASMAEYDSYIRNGLMTQLVRIRPGKQIEQAHMRGRALISHWSFEKGKGKNVIEFFSRNNKTYVKINDYKALREIFGELLKELQRIKSEGDFEAGKNLVENYGVKIDSALHVELLGRYAALNLAPYTGFVNPILIPDYNEDGSITGIRVEYADDFLSQMMYYGKNYSFLTDFPKK
jgi:dipeptidyl-peptidase-3